MTQTLFILGGTGFIGRETVAEAVRSGVTVRALARSDAAAAVLRDAGAEPVSGSAQDAAAWADALRGADAVIDLVQPALPKRLGGGAMRRIAAERLAVTGAVTGAIAALPAGERPLLVAVSGADDLQPDAAGRISHDASPRTTPRGFAHIGLPVRAAIETSGAQAAFVYFGNIVYGPGKGFAEHVVGALRSGRARVIGAGANRLPLVHVEDAARALVHVASLPREQTAGRTFIAIDGAGTTQRELFDDTAALMGVKAPGRAPALLAGLIAGPAIAQTMTLDAGIDHSALTATGFAFRYPSHREGVPATLDALGERAPA